MTRYLSEAMQPQRWVQAVWPWLVVAVLGIVAAEAVPNYTVSGAGDAAADGVFIATTTHASYLAISGMQLFLFQGRWYLGKSGTGPVLYAGACPSVDPPSSWVTYTWKGSSSPVPVPILSASPGVPALSACAQCAYTITAASNATANGCYQRAAPTLFRRLGSPGDLDIALYRRSHAEWVVGSPGGTDLYVGNCKSSTLPPADHGWHAATAATAGGPETDTEFGYTPPALVLSDPTVEHPLGYCAPSPPPPPKPHPRCATTECVAIWGPGGCPDLNGVAPDLVRPPMEEALPAAGKRVRAVAPGFEHSQVYHPLYLPTDWAAGPGQKFPVIVEYMGNGPFNDGFGDISSGRPEDSNLGWGMAEPAGSKYIWISMPFVSADLGNDTEVSTYWWGCPTSDASGSCGAAFDVSPTIRYLHSALDQAFSLYGGDPANVVITGWSRGAIATGAIGLHDDVTSKLFKAFVPYSHLDGDCGWVDDNLADARTRWARLAGRPTLYLGECAVATAEGPAWLAKLGINGTAAVSGMEFMTTGWANHNDAWVLRNSSARTYLREWLVKTLL